MNSTQDISSRMERLVSYMKGLIEEFHASASSLLVVQDGKIVVEKYDGHHHHKSGARKITKDSMFNLYSTRKTYVGLATAIAVVESDLTIDTRISEVVDELPKSELNDITFRNLATKTKAKYFGDSRIEREELACMAIKKITGFNIAELLTSRIFKPMNLLSTEWVTVPKPELVCDFQAGDGYASVRIESNEGHERNLYTNTSDLAGWGLLHLNRGIFARERLIPEEVFQLVDQLRAETQDQHRIFGWYYHDKWYYATGAAGCHCIVIPELNAVGVRMLNRYTSNYAEDQQRFNHLLYDCLGNMER